MRTDEGGDREMTAKTVRAFVALVMLLGFGAALMGCATTEDLKMVDQKAQAVGDKADRALSDAQSAKATAIDAANKAAAAADRAEKAAGRAEAAARSAADSAAKTEAIFMKKMKK
jgi:hypothetical protein